MSLDGDPLAYHHIQRDPVDNASTTPPINEKVRISSIWLFEAYTPTLVSNLQKGAQRLGWADSESLMNWDFPEQVAEMRGMALAAGWLNLGLIVSSDASASPFHHRSAPLPMEVSAIRMSILQPFPSTTIGCFQFILNETTANALDAPLRDIYKTDSESIEQGMLRIIGVKPQKRQAVDVMRAYLRSVCVKWVNEYFPGHFSLRPTRNSLPTCELLLISEQRDFFGSSTNQHHPSFLNSLGLPVGQYAWKSENLSGLFLQFIEGTNRAVLFGNLHDALRGMNLDGYGPTKETQIVHWVEHLDDTFLVWILDRLAQDFVREMAETRDAYGALDLSVASTARADTNPLDKKLLEFQRSAIPYSYDLDTYCESEQFFLSAVYEFKPVIEFAKLERNLFRDKRFSLMVAAKHIKQLEQQIRAIAFQTSQIISTMSSEAVVATNIALQKGIYWMTIVMLLLALLTAIAPLHRFLDLIFQILND